MNTKLTQSMFATSGGAHAASRVLFGGPPNSSLGHAAFRRLPLKIVLSRSQISASGRKQHAGGVRSRIRIGHASFFRKRIAQKLKSRIDITISTSRLGQYSKKFAPRRMIARMSAMKYVVGNSAPSA